MPKSTFEKVNHEHASQHSSSPSSTDAQEAAVAGEGHPPTTSDLSLATLDTGPAFHPTLHQQQQLHRRASDAGGAEQLQGGGPSYTDVAEEGRHKGGGGIGHSQHRKIKSVAVEEVPSARLEAPGDVEPSTSSDDNEARANLERTWSAQSHGEAASFSGRDSIRYRSAA